MFLKARLKLTFWYVVITLVISILFSLAIYQGLKEELERSLRIQQVRIYIQENNDNALLDPSKIKIDPQLLNDEENRIKLILLFINLGILVVAGGTGYFLAGKTLEPIAVMLDEQNRFITDASHELRTPITALRSEIEVNLRDKNLNLAGAKNLLKSNLEEAINLQILSNNLLELTQLEEPKSSFIFEDADLQAILEKALSRTAPLLKVKNIKVEKNLSKTSIHGSVINLTELFVILIDNAIKYSPSKSILKINMKKNDGFVYVEIEDQGMGIDKKDLPYIFDRFYRSDASRTKQKISGYGLGLSIAKKIVELHKGTISVKSEIGKGSIFTVKFVDHNL